MRHSVSKSKKENSVPWVPSVFRKLKQKK